MKVAALIDALLTRLETQFGAVRKEFDALSERIAAVEAKATEYRGTWQAACEYERGHLVTLGGSMWHCNAAKTRERPGDGRSWTLAVKNGAMRNE